MEKIPVSKFRNNLASILNIVQKGQSILITQRGQEIAKLIPVEDKTGKARERLLALGETATIGDVLSPIDAEWEVSE